MPIWAYFGENIRFANSPNPLYGKMYDILSDLCTSISLLKSEHYQYYRGIDSHIATYETFLGEFSGEFSGQKSHIILAAQIIFVDLEMNYIFLKMRRHLF